jgi:hypothetical protein
MEAVRKWPISRLFLVSCPDELSRANALSSSTGGASRRNAVTWPDEVTRPVAVNPVKGLVGQHRSMRMKPGMMFGGNFLTIKYIDIRY